MNPEAGEVWEWVGGQKFLLLRFVEQHRLGNTFWCLDLTTGEKKVYLFAASDLADGGWRRRA